jgi:hypothetical protein
MASPVSILPFTSMAFTVSVSAECLRNSRAELALVVSSSAAAPSNPAKSRRGSAELAAGGRPGLASERGKLRMTHLQD